MTFGQNLKKIREKAKLTQTEIANYLCLSHQSISKWENDVSLPALNYVIPLITILKSSFEEFFMFD